MKSLITLLLALLLFVPVWDINSVKNTFDKTVILRPVGLLTGAASVDLEGGWGFFIYVYFNW